VEHAGSRKPRKVGLRFTDRQEENIGPLLGAEVSVCKNLTQSRSRSLRGEAGGEVGDYVESRASDLRRTRAWNVTAAGCVRPRSGEKLREGKNSVRQARLEL